MKWRPCALTKAVMPNVSPVHAKACSKWRVLFVAVNKKVDELNKN